MLTWVVYDIADDKTRTRVARRVLGMGLYRVQKSVYVGDLEPNRIDEIEVASKELMDEETDSVYIFPMCEEDFRKVRLLGRGFDMDLVADKLLTKVI